ncbi:MAG: hypothetical protein V4724_41915 [Pseudomonadota bacterium]
MGLTPAFASDLVFHGPVALQARHKTRTAKPFVVPMNRIHVIFLQTILFLPLGIASS